MDKSTQNRIFYIDYLRAFLVVLVVLDHAMHGYAEHFQHLWFIQDPSVSPFLDILHLHNDSFMMPSLYFLAGIFVFPSLLRRGLKSFAIEKLLRLGIPFLVGIPTINAVISYGKFYVSQDYAYTNWRFWEFFRNVYLQNPIPGVFWFLAYLLALTTFVVVLYGISPKIIERLASLTQWLIRRPVWGFVLFSLLSAFILGVSDLIWGAPWWIGFWKIFYVRAARFILKIVYFFLGCGFGYAGLHVNQEFTEKLQSHWQKWFLLMIVAGGLYIGYTLSYIHEGAFSDDIRLYFKRGGGLAYGLTLLATYAPMVLLRTTLLGIFIASQLVAYSALFARFLNNGSKFWASLAACSYGIFMVHEPIVVWLHIWLLPENIWPVLKFVVSGGVALMVSWLLVQFVLLRLPGFKRIL